MTLGISRNGVSQLKKKEKVKINIFSSEIVVYWEISSVIYRKGNRHRTKQKQNNYRNTQTEINIFSSNMVAFCEMSLVMYIEKTHARSLNKENYK